MADNTGFYIASGLSGLLGGYVKGQAEKRKRELEERELALKERGVKVSEQEGGDKHLKALAEIYGTGLDFDKAGKPSFRASFSDPTSPEYTGFNRRAELEAMGKAHMSNGAPTLTTGDLYDTNQYLITGGKGMDPAVAERARKTPIGSGYQNFYSREKPTQGIPAGLLKTIPGFNVGDLADDYLVPYNSLAQFKTKPGPKLVPIPPEVAKEHDSYFGGPGSTAGLKPEQVYANLKAERTRRSGEKKDKGKAEKDKAQRAATAGVVTQDIDRVLSAMKASPYAVGPYAGQTKYVPGFPAYNLNNMLDSIRANVSFDKLQQMRQSSPTGAALGAVSDKENALLQAALGKLDVTMDPKDFAFNLERLRHQYMEVINGPGSAGPPPEPPEFAPAEKKGVSLKDKITAVFGGGNPSDQRAAAVQKDAPNPSDWRAGAQGKGAPVNGTFIPNKKLEQIRQFPEKGKPVRKQYNAKLNKTKIIYDTGEEVILDGRQ